MRIVFLGYAVNPSEAEKTNASIAGNKMQWNIIKELAKYDDVNISAYTVMPVSTFPYNGLYIKRSMEITTEGAHIEKVPFVNLPFIKQVNQVASIYKRAKYEYFNDKNTVFICFNLYPQVGLPFKWLLDKYNCRGIAILADPPIDDHSRDGSAYSVLLQLFKKMTCNCIDACKEMIVLNREAARQYSPNARNLLVDGAIAPEDFPPCDSEVWSGEEKNIVYAGALTEYSGVLQIINAMDFVTDKKVCLNIYGSGVLTNKIERIAAHNQRIHFFGRVSNAQMIAIQRRAWLLVNVRDINNPIARVTFPSKILEYMMSGRPVLTTRLNSFSESGYEDKMFYIDNSLPETIGKKIDDIASMNDEQVRIIAENAKSFVLSEKTWSVQVAKIYDFIKNKL